MEATSTSSRQFAPSTRWNAAILLATDVAAILLASSLAYLSALAMSPLLTGWPFPNIETALQMRLSTFLPALAVVLWRLQAVSHYSARIPFWTEARDLIGITVLAFLVEGFLQYAGRDQTSRLWIGQSWAFAIPSILVLRLVAKTMLVKSGLRDLPVVIFGNTESVQHTVSALTGERLLGYRIVSIMPLPSPEEAIAQMQKLGARKAVIAFSENASGCAAALANHFTRAGIPFSIALPPTGMANATMEAQAMIGHDVVFLSERTGLLQPAARLVKRSTDIALSALGLVITSPLLLIIALLVRLDGGPAFYGHIRVGMNGHTFRCLKFRSMRVNSGEVLEHILSTDPERAAEWAADRKFTDDPRVTRLGNFLRRSALDEIPQLWNVLRGEMSLVGPRPVTVEELDEHYRDERTAYLRVRPGLTGLWQASGRNTITYDRRVAMDSWYVRNWSMGLDLVLVLKTIPVLLTRRGAA